jgi:ribosomal protein S18 acetylase RimI-like enzyme
MNVDADRAAAAMQHVWRELTERAPQGMWRRADSGVIAFVSGLPAPPMNGAYAFGPEVDFEELRSSLQAVAEADVPFCLHGRPSMRGPLAALADEFGLVLEEEVPMMVLDDPQALEAATQIDGLQVRQLADAEQDVHIEVAAAGFGMPIELAHEIMKLVGLGPGQRIYVGLVGATPVTTAIAQPSVDDSVGIFNVATPPEHRRHGYGGAVTAAAILDSLRRGATWAWLQTSADGFPVYQRLGFRVAEIWPLWVTPSPLD